MVDVLDQATNHAPDIRVIIVTGDGKFFCTGMDLGADDTGFLSFVVGSDIHRLNELLIRCDKNLIAAVNGPAVGFGATSLALFDLVYAVPDAYFFTPFVKWGMTTEACSSYTFPRIMGHQRAALLCLAGDTITAHQAAQQFGLVSRVLPQDGFRDAVLAIAVRIASSPPGSLRTTKQLLRRAYGGRCSRLMTVSVTHFTTRGYLAASHRMR